MELKELKKSLNEYLVIEERIKKNIGRAEKYRNLDDQSHDAYTDEAEIMSLMQVQSQVIRLSEYIDQQYMSLVEIQRQYLELEKEIMELEEDQ